MTEADPIANINVVLTNLNARVDLLSNQILQLASVQGSTNERSSQNQQELINYVTTKIGELAQSIGALQTTSNGNGDAPAEPDESAARVPSARRSGRT